MTRSVEIPEAAVDYLGRLWWKQYDTESPYQHAQSVAKTREAIEGLLPYLAPAGDGGLREALEKLAEEWRYKGEFGWGPWQAGEGPDPEGAVLDDASAEVRKLLAAHPAAPAVPQPVDREALEAALGQYIKNWAEGGPLARALVANQTDAVLAVLAGEQEQVEP